MVGTHLTFQYTNDTHEDIILQDVLEDVVVIQKD
jgi:hypothetical protein